MKRLQHILMAGLAVSMIAGAAGCKDSPTDTVVNVYLQYKQGDQFTYNYYQRDSLNVNDPSSKQVRVWTVLKTGTSVDGKDGAVQIEEVIKDASGTTETGRDTVYLQTSGQGQVFQYDILGKFLSLLPAAAAYRDSVSAEWVQIGDTKITGAANIVSLPGNVTVNNVMIGGFPVNISLSMTGSHKGRQNITTPAKTFTNNFHTDHSMIINASTTLGPLGKDSLQVHYDIDTDGGIVLQSVDSKKITFTIGTVSQSQQVPGFEMQLISYTRK